MDAIDAFRLSTLDVKPELANQLGRLNRVAWPYFMLQDPVADEYFGRLFDLIPNYQAVLYDDEDRLIAMANMAPLAWDLSGDALPEGWDDVITQAIQDVQRGNIVNIASALSMTVDPKYQRKGISRLMLRAMRGIAAQHNLSHLIAPVRPNQKHLYPLIPIDRYITWTHEDGSPFDGWMRTHWRLGARIVRSAPRSMVIPGTVEQWERWTEMRFPDSGTYIVKDALAPLEINREEDTGLYIEPNIWMVHTVQSDDLGLRFVR